MTKFTTQATEFIDVQEALGIKLNAVTSAAFIQADKEHADRICMMEKTDNGDHFLAVFVDNKLVVFRFNGRFYAADETEVRELFNI